MDDMRAPLTPADVERLAVECLADALDEGFTPPLTLAQEAALLGAIRRVVELVVHEFRPPG